MLALIAVKPDPAAWLDQIEADLVEAQIAWVESADLAASLTAPSDLAEPVHCLLMVRAAPSAALAPAPCSEVRM